MNKFIAPITRWLIVLAMPIFLVLTAAHLMIADWYPHYEYAKPNFPPDRYGFTQEQRLELSLVSIHFLQSHQPPEVAIAMLQEQRLPGTNDPLFDHHEISHMLDVKRFTDLLWRIQAVAGVIVAGGVVLLLARRETRRDGFAALFGGGILTSGLLTGLAAFVLLSWRTFFIQFHELFFRPGTWTFDWSDSLIRLFPDKFWSDAGTILTGGALVAGLVVAGVGYILGKRKL